MSKSPREYKQTPDNNELKYLLLFFKNQIFYFICKLYRILFDNFKREIDKRRDAYLEQKSIKEKLFQEIEHDKAQIRIIETRADKTTSSQIMRFPLNIDVSLMN